LTKKESHCKASSDFCVLKLSNSRAVEEIYKQSCGIPRMINRFCEKSLMYAYQQRKRLIDDHMVKYVSEHENIIVM
jgi:hypothetical protein